MGRGKTFFSVMMASHYRRIYSNFDITLRWKSVTNIFTEKKQLQKIEYSDTKGIILLDEEWLNNNSRRSSSESNMEFAEVLVLSRKKNVDIVTISQLERMKDVYVRELSSYGVEMIDPVWVTKKKIIFQYDIYRWDTYEGTKVVDLIEWTERTWYEYNTLDDSVMQGIKKDKRNYIDRYIDDFEKK